MSNEWRVASGERRVPDRALAGARDALSPSLSRNSQLATRNLPRAFTLIELLVTMVIISIISAAILGTASAALDAARRSRTQTVINRIHLLLMEKWEGYETRRLDLNPNMVAAINSAAGPNSVLRGQMLADLRLLALRELIKYEMPDRWSDVTGDRLGQTPVPPLFLASRPALAESYLRLSSVTEENEGAECLYALVMLGTGDGEARTQFTDQDIGDGDGDGAPEFLDGWGNPIAFLRWAPGYASLSNYMSPELDPKQASYNPQLAATSDHDPFDLFRRDQPNTMPAASLYPSNTVPSLRPFIQHLRDPTAAFRLVPLIFSAGPDGQYDIISAREAVVTASGSNNVALDPYAVNGVTNDFYFGRPKDENDDGEGWHDNITNHDIKY